MLLPVKEPGGDSIISTVLLIVKKQSITVQGLTSDFCSLTFFAACFIGIVECQLSPVLLECV